MGTLLKHITTGKLVRFIASIPTQGQGLIHLVEDFDTGFVKAYQNLKEYILATEEDATAPVAPAPVDPAPLPIPAQPVPLTPPPIAPAPQPHLASGVAGVGPLPPAQPGLVGPTGLAEPVNIVPAAPQTNLPPLGG